MFQELQGKVTAEQEEYMAYLEGVARQFVADYNSVHPVAEKFVSVGPVIEVFEVQIRDMGMVMLPFFHVRIALVLN